jgi:hypothetical protein
LTPNNTVCRPRKLSHAWKVLAEDFRRIAFSSLDSGLDCL